MWILQDCLREWESEEGTLPLITDLVAEADQLTPGSFPFFNLDDARFFAPGVMTTRISDLCVENGFASPTSRAEFVATISESLARAYTHWTSEAARVAGISFDRIRIVGGGARNALVCQRTADLSGRCVVAGPFEASSLGNIAVQLVAAGEFRDLDAVYAAADADGLLTTTYVPRLLSAAGEHNERNERG